MTKVSVDGTDFAFPAEWEVSIFDTWPQFIAAASRLGLKGCDVVAIAESRLWLIEMKDYTYAEAVIPDDLGRIVGQKTAGTMALLFSLARKVADSDATAFARSAQSAREITMALHVQLRTRGRHPQQLLAQLAPIKQQIRQAQVALGVNKFVVTSNVDGAPSAPWRAERDPATRGRHVD